MPCMCVIHRISVGDCTLLPSTCAFVLFMLKWCHGQRDKPCNVVSIQKYKTLIYIYGFHKWIICSVANTYKAHNSYANCKPTLHQNLNEVSATSAKIIMKIYPCQRGGGYWSMHTLHVIFLHRTRV